MNPCLCHEKQIPTHHWCRQQFSISFKWKRLIPSSANGCWGGALLRGRVCFFAWFDWLQQPFSICFPRPRECVCVCVIVIDSFDHRSKKHCPARCLKRWYGEFHLMQASSQLAWSCNERWGSWTCLHGFIKIKRSWVAAGSEVSLHNREQLSIQNCPCRRLGHKAQYRQASTKIPGRHPFCYKSFAGVLGSGWGYETWFKHS